MIRIRCRISHRTVRNTRQSNIWQSKPVWCRIVKDSWLALALELGQFDICTELSKALDWVWLWSQFDITSHAPNGQPLKSCDCGANLTARVMHRIVKVTRFGCGANLTSRAMHRIVEDFDSLWLWSQFDITSHAPNSQRP